MFRHINTRLYIFLLVWLLAGCQASSPAMPAPTLEQRLPPESTPTPGLPPEVLPAAATLAAAATQAAVATQAASMVEFAAATATAAGIELLSTPETSMPAPVPSVVEAAPAGSPRLCLAEQPGLQPPPLQYETATLQVLDYLNAGASLADLDEALYAANLHSLPTALARLDFTGDGWLDLVLSIYDANAPAFPPPGKLAWYVCQAGQYTLAGEQDSASDIVGGPHLWYWLDMDADGADDLLVSLVTCGASTCFDTFQLLSWNGNALVNRLEATRPYPFPDALVQDLEGDGLYELVIKAGEAGSVGAGPQRGETLVFRLYLPSNHWRLEETTLAPSSFRVHAFQDADQAVRQGDFLAALGLYGRVATDDRLQDWEDAARERSILSAIARFRMVQVYLALGDQGTARAILAEQRAALPANSPFASYLEMTQGYLDAFLVGGQTTACDWVQAYASLNAAAVLDPLGPATFGYANLSYQPADLCLPAP